MFAIPLREEKFFSQRTFSIYTDIRKLQDKAKTSNILKGMTQLVQTISKVKKYINPDIKIDGMLLTLVYSRTDRVFYQGGSVPGEHLVSESKITKRACHAWDYPGADTPLNFLKRYHSAIEPSLCRHTGFFQ